MDKFEWPENGCHFMEKGQCCAKHRGATSWFCAEHEQYFVSKSNQEMLEMQATATVKALEVKDGSIQMKGRGYGEVWDDFHNSWHELLHRNYIDTDIQQCVSSIIEQKNLFADISKKLGHDPKWKKFEKIVAGIHVLQSEGAKVKFDDQIKGRRTGGMRQIDVSVIFKHGIYDYLIIVECKDYKQKISIDRVEALRTKMEDVGAHKGILVSAKGFQAGAKKAADAYNIELYTLTEETTDWTKQVLENVFQVAFPVGYSFDCPPFSGYGGHPSPDLRDFIFRENENSKSFTLAELTLRVSEWATKSQMPLPCRVNWQFSEKKVPWQVKFPGHNVFVPIFGVTFELEAHEHKAKVGEIDVPPKKVAYVYSDVKQGKEYKYRVEDIKKTIEDFDSDGSGR